MKPRTILSLWIISFSLASVSSLSAQTDRLVAKFNFEIKTLSVSNALSLIKVDNAFLKSDLTKGSKVVMELSLGTNGTSIVFDVVDPEDNILRELFSFDNVTTLDTGKGFRFFALGTGVDTVPTSVLGDVQFGDTTLFGTITSDSNGAPSKVTANLQGNGTADNGDILIDGKVSTAGPFVPGNIVPQP